MKKWCLAVLSLSLSSSIFAAPLQDERMNEPLMASHLSEQLLQSIHAHTKLTYATGHSVYDTSVILMDDEGQQIDKKHQYDVKKHYQLVHLGTAAPLSDYVWFFSPKGTNSEQLSEKSCTFEEPCQQLTQDILNFVHQNFPIPNSYWLATGTYDLPVIKQHDASPQLLEFYANEHVVGRTADLLHTPYGKERPLILGTLAWIGYHGHTPGYATVSNVRITTKNNEAQLLDSYFRTNIYSKSLLYVENSELNFTNEDHWHGTNIRGNEVTIHNCVLSATGLNAVVSNIAAVHAFSSYQSKLISKHDSDWGTSKNIQFYGGVYGQIGLYDTQLKLETSSRGVAIDLGGTNDLWSHGLDIDMQTLEECQECDSDASSNLTAITSSNFKDGDLVRIFLTHAKINITAKNINVYAVTAWLTDVILDDTAISLNSAQKDAVIFNTDNSALEFKNNPSTLSLTSPTWAGVIYDRGKDSVPVLNNSTPASQCIINGNPAVDC